MKLFLGIDLGTGSCKASLIDQNGQVLSIGSGKYIFPAGTSHWKEQKPDVILRGMIDAVQTAIFNSKQNPSNIEAISIGSALHGIMAIDSSGEPLTYLFTWADDRAAHQAENIENTQLSTDLYQQTGCPPHGMYPLYKILWLRENQPEIFHQAAKFISIKEYILEKLCGDYLVDYAIASGTGLLNTHTHQWNPLSLELAKITPGQLSSLAGPRHRLKIKNLELAAQLKIPPDTPLILGASDAVNSNLGAGALSEKQATCMIGTSGAYRIISPRPLLHPKGSSWCYCVDENHWLVGGAINNGGLALTWLRDLLQKVTENNISFENLLEFAEKSEIGADGVICLPFFAGERSPHWNLDARAAFLGLSIDHDITHISRSIIEGIAFRLRTLNDILLEMNSDFSEVKEVRASGGFTQSNFWLQLVTDVLGRPISVPEEGETSCLGAAFWGYLGQNPTSALTDLSHWVKISKTYQPQKEANEKYDKMFVLYKNLYGAISPFFKEMKQLHSEMTGKFSS